MTHGCENHNKAKRFSCTDVFHISFPIPVLPVNKYKIISGATNPMVAFSLVLMVQRSLLIYYRDMDGYA
jgi:hypothetical protein